MVVKKISEILTIAIWMVGGILLLALPTHAAPNPNFHIYIAYGQSNMAGNGEIHPDSDQVAKPNFIMLASHTAYASQRSGNTNQSIETGKWYPAIPPMFHSFENLSPADYFGRAMVDSLPGVTVGIIPVAIGAVSIRAFDKDQYQAYFDGDGKNIKGWGWINDYDENPPGRILELAKKAKEVGVIKGFIFHQGESDGTDDNWRNTVYKTYKDIVDALGLNENEVPFVAGELMNDPDNSGKGSCCGSKNGGIAQLKSKFKKFGLASSEDLKGNGQDSYHFNRDGVIKLGQRYCSEMLKLIDKTIDPNAPAVNVVDPSQSTVPDDPPEEFGPYSKEPIAIPGLVQAENYNKGGANKAYYDMDESNRGNKFRKDGVDIYQPNMGLSIGYCQKGEWLKYSVNVAAEGEYEISASVAGDNGTGSFVLYMDDEQIGTEMVNEKLGFENYTTVSGGKAILKAGEHTLKLEITNDWIDIDYIEFKANFDITASIIDSPLKLANNTEATYNLFDMQGKHITRFNANSMSSAVRKVKDGMSNLRQGVYLLRCKGPARIQQKIVYKK